MALERQLTQLRPYLFRDESPVGSFYIKQSISLPGLPRSSPEEFSGYCVLRPYLDMPKARMLGGDLVVAGVAGQEVDQLISTFPERAVQAYSLFVKDMLNMWKCTQTDLQEHMLIRDTRQESLATAKRLLNEPCIQELLDKKLVINDLSYLPLGITFRRVISDLSVDKDPKMVLRHGDEHAGNVFATEQGYKAIDPQYTGMGSPYQALNNMIGTNYIFYYDYNIQKYETDTSLNIKYATTTDTAQAEKEFGILFNSTINEVKEMADSTDHLLYQYLFINLMRIYTGWVRRPQDVSHIFKNKYAFVALANEFYYGKGMPQL